MRSGASVASGAGRSVASEPVHVVLDDPQAVRARDRRDLAPPRLRHHGGRRVVERRNQVDGLHAALATSLLERVRPQAEGVDRQAAQAQPQQAGHRLEPRVGERLGEQHVARLEQRREHDREAVLAAGADEHFVGRDLEPGPRDPGRPRFAVRRSPARGRIVEQPADVAARGEAGERGDERRTLRPRGRLGRMVLAQVAHFAVVRGALGHRPAHERAPSHLARDQPAARGLRVGAADRADGDAERVGEIPVRGQPRPLPQLSGGEVVGDRLDDREIARPLASFEARAPHCHGHNIAIDSVSSQY